MARKQRPRRMVVREIVPGRLWVVACSVVVLVLVAAAAGWHAGRYLLLVSLAGGDADVRGGSAMLERLADENRLMRDELAVSRNGDELSRAVEERVRSDNRELQDRIAELEQAVASYRRVAVPDPGGKGLRIDRIGLVQTADPAVWALSILLVRAGGTDSAADGHIEGTLLADGPAGRVALPLRQLLAGNLGRFHVRYVDELKFDLRLPPSHVPVRLDIAAIMTAPRQDRVEKSWQRQAIREPGGIRNAGQG